MKISILIWKRFVVKSNNIVRIDALAYEFVWLRHTNVVINQFHVFGRLQPFNDIQDVPVSEKYTSLKTHEELIDANVEISVEWVFNIAVQMEFASPETSIDFS